jgi:Isochorismatase family
VERMNRALLVVDMQNGFCHPEGSFTRIGMGLEGAEDAVRNAAVAIEQARRAAIPVVFTRHLYRPGRADEGQALKQNSPALAGLHGLQGGTWDAEVVAELGCGPSDLVVDKVRFDAFQWTSLEPLLRGLGVDDLVVCGNRLNTRKTSRQPSKNNPRNPSATPTNAAAVPCPATTRRTMPSPAAPSHAPRPAGASATGRRQARTAAQPRSSPARNGHAVEATPLSPRPSA